MTKAYLAVSKVLLSMITFLITQGEKIIKTQSGINLKILNSSYSEFAAVSCTLSASILYQILYWKDSNLYTLYKKQLKRTQIACVLICPLVRRICLMDFVSNLDIYVSNIDLYVSIMCLSDNIVSLLSYHHTLCAINKCCGSYVRT